MADDRPRDANCQRPEPDVQARAITVNDAELAWIEQGTGDPVILIHGSLGDYRSWNRQMDPFAQRYRVVAYSRRRHWPNAWPADGTICAAEVHAADLAALIETLGHGPAHLAGSSYGALTALVMAARRPELVRSLVLGEPPLLAWLAGLPEGSARYAAFLAQSWEPARRAFRNGDSLTGVRRFIDGVLGAGQFDRLSMTAQGGIMDNAPEFTLELETSPATYFSALKPADVVGLGIPTLLLTGERSPRMFHDVIDVLARTLPDCEQVEIPDASHSMHAGNPEAYNQTVLGFLARH